MPDDSRVGKGRTWIKDQLDDAMVAKLNKLNDIAAARGQKLSQMALSWVLSNPAVTTVLIGASIPSQITDNVEAVYKMQFTPEEKKQIEAVLAE